MAAEKYFPENSSVGAVRFSLGRALIGERRYHEAEAALTEAESFYAKQPQPMQNSRSQTGDAWPTLTDIFLQIHKALNQP